MFAFFKCFKGVKSVRCQKCHFFKKYHISCLALKQKKVYGHSHEGMTIHNQLILIRQKMGISTLHSAGRSMSSRGASCRR